MNQHGWASLVLLLLSTGFSRAAETSPPVVDVGSRKQLFVDETLIESSQGVRLTMNPPHVDPTCLVKADLPWESAPNAGICFYSSVIKDGDRIRLWYDVYSSEPKSRRVAYAESKDGIHFTKPVLGLHEVDGSKENNVVLPGEIGGCAVWIDPKAPASQRYKTQAKTYPSGKMQMHASPDGLTWTLIAEPDIGHKDTQTIVLWDETISRYVMYTRRWFRNKESQNASYRTVRRLESDDLKTWTGESIVMKADDADLATHKTPTGQPPVDYYGATVFKYPDGGGVYVMLAQAFWHWMPRDPLPRLGPNAFDVRLAVSRDGKAFKRLGGRAPFLRLGPAGSFYSRMIWALPDPIRMGDELWIYFAGSNIDHADVRDPAASGRLSGIGRAVMRLDGFVSTDAGYEGGQLVTPPLRFAGKRLELNVDTSAGGCVKVELLDASGKPIEGFREADCVPVCGNSVRMPVTWRGGGDVDKLAGKTIQLRLVMKDCKLYAFQFAE
ncbi:MAG: hypothetical protein JXQ73_04795 [Phycisphaerae bacterium]|nr:hypothetical protein [Phycisphaerae bacterium]